MDIKKLNDRTTVYETLLQAKPISWLAGTGAVERIFAEKLDDIWLEYLTSGEVPESYAAFPDADNSSFAVVGYYFPNRLRAHRIEMEYKKLPVEFFNHQLMECDCNNEESIFAFVSEWGFPFSPQRVSYGIGTSIDCDYSEIDTESILGIAHTTILEKRFIPSDEEHAPLPWEIISFQEAKTTIRALQITSKSVTDFVRSEKGSPWIEFINAAICNPHYVSRIPHASFENETNNLTKRGFLSSAVCNQIVNTITDEAPWRLCACEGCNRIFKRRQSKSNNPDSDSIYCCDKCSERQKKRNQRAAAKNRIKH